ncbi:MAG: class I SAM-dependent methyltransferase, partial [Bauldia sp.]
MEPPQLARLANNPYLRLRPEKPSMTDAHWNDVYGTKADGEMSWFQARPERSLALIREASPDRASAIVDIGAGTSTLIDTLLAEGYRDFAALDISAAAIARLRNRLGYAGVGIETIAADITEWRPKRQWDIWHDRAVFHFLTNAAIRTHTSQHFPPRSAPAARQSSQPSPSTGRRSAAG